MLSTFAGSMYLLFGLTLIFVSLSLLLVRGLRRSDEVYNTASRFFLVGLRLAIGWHFYVEGMEKLRTPGWSSEPYLREAVGPLAGHFRSIAGDRLVDKLTSSDPKELPAALDLEWQAYRDAFAAHYELQPEQLTELEKKYEAARAGTAKWLADAREEVVKTSQYPPELKVPMTMAKRLEEHERLVQKVREAEARLPSADADLQKRYKDAKADLNRWRAGLKKSLDAQTAEMKKSLQDSLSKEQQSTVNPLPSTVPLPVRQWQLLEWSDASVTWGLIVLGGALLVGLFSRLASFLGALLVLSFYLAMPPLPGWPESPRLEGHYLIINKTLIEFLALSALTFIPTGRWAGIDGLLQLSFLGGMMVLGGPILILFVMSQRPSLTDFSNLQPKEIIGLALGSLLVLFGLFLAARGARRPAPAPQ